MKMETRMSLEAFAENGRFAPSRIATTLRTTLDEVARTVGLGRDAVMRQDRIDSPRTQKRLREMVEILNRVEPRFGSALIAYAWYRLEPLAGFGAGMAESAAACCADRSGTGAGGCRRSPHPRLSPGLRAGGDHGRAVPGRPKL